MSKRLVALLFGLGLVAAACGADEATDAVAEVVESADDEMADDEMSDDDMADDEMSDDEMSDDDMSDDDMSDDDMADDEMSDDDMAEGPAALQLASTELGDILVDIHGDVVYVFVPDAQGTPTCVGACLDAWPIVVETLEVGDGLNPELLGSVEHPTGVLQATYNGWPLYYFANDTTAGDTNGQGANDLWFVIDAEGNAVS